jgi:hypothetical protein
MPPALNQPGLLRASSQWLTAAAGLTGGKVSIPVLKREKLTGTLASNQPVTFLCA